LGSAAAPRLRASARSLHSFPAFPVIKLRTQTVYSKALAAFVALSLLLGLAVVSLTQAIIAREFRQTERRQMLVSMQRLELLLSMQCESVRTALGRWVAETGAMGGRESGLPVTNILESLDLEWLGVLSPDGRFLEVTARDPGIRDSGLEYLGEEIIAANASAGASGFERIGGNFYVVAWQGAPAGFPKNSLLVAARLVSGEVTTFLQAVMGGNISFRSMSNITIGSPGTEPLMELMSSEGAVVDDSTTDEIRGIGIVRRINGTVLGTVELAQERTLERSGEGAVQIFLTVLVLAGGVLFGLVWFVLDRTILARVRELSRQVEAEKSKGSLPVELAFSGTDELGQLARRIEELAGLLDKLQSQYRAVVEDQTEIICRFDEGFRITLANGVFRRLFLADREIHPEKLQACIPQPTFEFLARRYARLYPAAPLDTFEHRAEVPEERELWLRSTLRRNFDSAGTPMGGQWVASDVTSLVHAERELQASERQLRTLSGRLLTLQDEERRRIARELHDSTAQNLSALEMNMSLLEPVAKDPRTRRIVAETRRIAQDCCQELRNISYLLHPPLLDEVGLTFAIRWFTDGFTARTGIEVDLSIDEDFPRLESEIETSLFRTIQEATSNIYRHSGATRAELSLSIAPDGEIRLRIADNGRGFSPPAPTPENGGPAQARRMGIGLPGMRERLLQFGGNLSIENSPHGVTILIVLPNTTRHASGQKN